MYSFLLIIHVLVSIALMIVILMQASKGGGLAGVFGGSTVGSVFGGRGVASFLSKLTTGLAIAFLVLCLVLGRITSGDSGARMTQSAVQRARENTVIPMHPEGQPTSTGEGETTPEPTE
ncbi:preprotein translocase subunit SecG [candidate division KSB1 bacterium]|nr:preprotein translocase subunit SecG [candidate division KSB1 bacterium]